MHLCLANLEEVVVKDCKGMENIIDEESRKVKYEDIISLVISAKLPHGQRHQASECQTRLFKQQTEYLTDIVTVWRKYPKRKARINTSWNFKELDDHLCSSESEKPRRKNLIISVEYEFAKWGLGLWMCR
ncbi:hypothetical protein AAHA92_28401 [Salvia divinorum]|uniref:Uncharacterized protein n=1 Tax=Salvia divinorum TaxID=28513 RepID=A0ABD1FXD5_SALDI